MTYSAIIKIKDALVLASDTRISSATHPDIFSDNGKKLYTSSDFNVAISFGGINSYRIPNGRLIYLGDCFEEFINYAKQQAALLKVLKANNLAIFLYFFLAYCVRLNYLPKDLNNLKSLPGVNADSVMLFQAIMSKKDNKGHISYQSSSFNVLSFSDLQYALFRGNFLLPQQHVTIENAVDLKNHDKNDKYFLSNILACGNANDRLLRGMAMAAAGGTQLANTQADMDLFLNTLQSQVIDANTLKSSIEQIFTAIIALANSSNPSNVYFQDKTVGGQVDYAIFYLNGSLEHKPSNTTLRKASDIQAELEQQILALQTQQTAFNP